MAEALYHLRDIRKTFRVGLTDVNALAGVNLTLFPGEVLALQGPSGSGKSTLLNVLGLLEQPSTGSLSFNGLNTISARDSVLTKLRRDNIGFIFQNFNLVPILTALENVEYALYIERRLDRQAIRQQALQCLHDVGLERFVDHRPAELSGGQRQRVAIARAIVKKPKVILADEPTANLDSKTATQIIGLIRDLNRNYKTAVFVATHDSEIANSADRIVRIKDGALLN